MDDKLKIETYREMVLIRKFEEEAATQYEAGNIRGFLHLYIGQEAVAAGFLAAARSDDYVMGSYRDHGQAISRCFDTRRVMAELFGKSTGSSKGKGGSMHLFDKDRNFMGGTAIVGGGLPISVGIAYSIKYRKTDQVCICFFGDGAVNEGAFHESMNLASLWNLPVLFVCENNMYGMGTSVSRASAIPSLFRRAQCYAMDVRSVDGMDVEKVYDTAFECIEKMRKDKQPIFIEAETYRYRGHSQADPQNYRTKEEVEEWKKKDPIVTFGAKLINEGIISQEVIDKIDSECSKTIKDAVEFASTSPKPLPEDIYKDIYA